MALGMNGNIPTMEVMGPFSCRNGNRIMIRPTESASGKQGSQGKLAPIRSRKRPGRGSRPISP
eukprot:14919174-Heterocapsa_arctica.AAC.1